MLDGDLENVELVEGKLLDNYKVLEGDKPLVCDVLGR